MIKTVKFIIQKPPHFKILKEFKNFNFYEYNQEKDDFSLIKKEEQIGEDKIIVGTFYYKCPKDYYFKIEYLEDKIVSSNDSDKNNLYYHLTKKYIHNLKI